MKIATWNINGVRGRLPLLLKWLAKAKPDVVALQELKTPDDLFPEAELRKAGYGVVWAGERAYNGVALVKFSLPETLSRAEAARRIACEMTALISALDPPGTLMVAGGETLKAACLALGAHVLQVTGRIVPGLPRSILQGGRWAGVEVVSKSGAFGTRELWRDLLHDNQLLSMRKPT